MSMLAAALEKVRATDFEPPDRWDLTNWLLKCQNMDRKEARMRIINDLPEQIRTSRSRDDQNDKFDIRGIVDACLNYSGGLKELMSILSAVENNSEQLQDVENYLGSFLQKKHIIAPDPEAEKQIEQLTSLIVGMQGFINAGDLEQVYHASAPQLNFSDTTWRYPQDPHLAHVVDRILHHLNVAPASRLRISPILIFVERLACWTQDKQEQQKLRTWVDMWIDNQAVPAWQVKAEAISALRRQPAEDIGYPIQPAEPFSPSLMIQLEPLDNQNLNQFTVKAWLKYGQEDTACQSLEVPPEQIFDPISILELLEIWLDELDANGTIEFFLPRRLFNLRVDEWKMPSEQGKTLGVLYRVVLRSSERFVRPISRVKGTWKENWRRIKNLQPGEDVIKWLSDIQEYDGESLFYKLTDENKFVLWLLLSPFTIDPDDKRLVFFNMLKAGTPIALWLKEPANGQEGEKLKTLLSQNSLSDWPRLIFEQRRRAAALLREAMLHGEDVEKIQHPGRYFTLFWDDPTSMPLEFTLKFQETGIRKMDS